MEKLKKDMRRANFKKYGNLFPFYIPAAIFAILFMYVPMLGLVMAFKGEINMMGADSPVQGILQAEWVGLKNFEFMFSDAGFLKALRNTLIISMLKIIIVFPLPILLAILLTESKSKFTKKAVKITMYLPYFLSWAIIGGIFSIILNERTGLFNNLIEKLGWDRIPFITSNEHFRGVIVTETIWKDLGWSAITYIAAIASVDKAQIEAARIDGATKVQRIKHIILPGIMSTIAVLFILRIGYVMDAGFEQIFVMYNPFIQETGDILGTYTYRLLRGTDYPNYNLSTAIGLFNSIIAFTLVIFGNFFSKKFFNRGVW